MDSVGPVVPTNEVETKFETIEVDNFNLWSQWSQQMKLTIKFESIWSRQYQPCGPSAVPTEVETKFETIEVDNTIYVGPVVPTNELE